MACVRHSTLKTDIIKAGLVFSISIFFITKMFLANKWMRKEIPSCSNSALFISSSYWNPQKQVENHISKIVLCLKMFCKRLSDNHKNIFFLFKITLETKYNFFEYFSLYVFSKLQIITTF